jgi:phytol kinase
VKPSSLTGLFDSMTNMDVIRWNIFMTIVTVVYVKIIVAWCDYAKEHRWLPSDVTRKIIHLAAACWCMFWPYFDTAHWTWQLNVVVPAVYAVQLFVKGAILRNPDDVDVKTMSRSGNPRELIEGPLIFTLLMVYCGLCQFRSEVGICIMAGVGIGDGLAPLVGSRWPVKHYRSLSTVKSYAGSLTVFISTFIGVRFLELFINNGKGSIDRSAVFLVSAATTVAEALSGKWDNISIPLAMLVLQKCNIM